MYWLLMLYVSIDLFTVICNFGGLEGRMGDARSDVSKRQASLEHSHSRPSQSEKCSQDASAQPAQGLSHLGPYSDPIEHARSPRTRHLLPGGLGVPYTLLAGTKTADPRLTAVFSWGIQGRRDCLSVRERGAVSSGAPMLDGEKDSRHKRTRYSH